MRNELTNLLPNERLRAIRLDYFIRLGVIAALIVTMLTSAAAILLLPTYIFLTASASSEKTRLANIESSLSSSNDVALSAQLTALSNSAKILSVLGSVRTVSEITRDVLVIPRPGITLSGLAYSPATSKSQNIFTISGISATRDALRSYQLALQSAPFVSSANLPVSVYAKDTNIAFTITITLAP